MRSTLKVTVTLAANIGFVPESSANKVKVKECDVFNVLRLKITEEKQIGYKECYCFGHRMSTVC